MRKIPTLFVRDPDDMRRVLPEVHPDCKWVLDGEGTATRKYDGICVRLTRDGPWWARREIKPGKEAPANFVPEQLDEATGKTFGWEPIEQTGWVKYLNEATTAAMPGLTSGTYELCGPKINRNPEGYPGHRLIRHEVAEVDVLTSNGEPRDFAGCRSRVVQLGERGWEGIVWHHPDGRMAKLKARDFKF